MLQKFAKLILEPTKSNSVLEVFLVDEKMAEKSNLGRMFVLVEINSKERGIKEKVKEIFEMIKNDYYASPVPNIETSFEITCQNLNLNFKDIFNKPEAWYKKINILIGVIKDDKLVFSHLGNFSGYLIRKNKISQILNTQSDENETLFAQLTSGETKDGDVIILSNYTLFDFFSLEKIKNILSKLNPEQSVEQFKNLIDENAKNVNALSLVIKSEKNLLEVDEAKNLEEINTKKYIQELYGSQESIQQLENLKQKTNSTLADCIWPNFDKLKKIFSKLKPNKKSKKLKMPNKKNKVEDLSGGHRNLLKSVHKIKRINLIFVGKMRWVLFGLIGVFVLSLFYIGYSQNIKQKDNANQEILASVQNKQDESEAALIYQDKEKANELLISAKLELKNINLFNKKWQERYNEQNNLVQKMINKINNIFEVATQESAVLEQGKINKIILDIEKEKSYLINENGKVFVNENNVLNSLNNLDTLNIVDIAFIVDNKGMVVLDDNNKFYIYKNEKLEELNITLLEDAIVNEFELYGERIYFLDNLHGVYKVSNITSANPQMTVWYAEDKDLINSAQQVFVDGNVWINSLNQIVKLYRSRKVDFNLSGLNKEIAKDFKIYTTEDLDDLYVLDKNLGRIVVSDKNGVVKKQFLNDELKNAENFVINNNKVIFNTSNKILEMDLTEE